MHEATNKKFILQSQNILHDLRNNLTAEHYL